MINSDMSILEGYDDRVSLRHAALGLLAKGPASGYDLLKTFKSTMHPVWPATQSQLYGELNKLASAGFTTAAAVGARGRKEYAITDVGRAELHRWMTSPDEDPPQRSAVLLRVFLLGELTPSEARQYIESLRDWVEQELRSYEEIRDSSDWSDNDSDFFARVALEHLLRAARRDADWTKWVLDELNRREQPGQPASSTS
jgi:PadR family transcriptional regulator, regulatory protein AphA